MGTIGFCFVLFCFVLFWVVLSRGIGVDGSVGMITFMCHIHTHTHIYMCLYVYIYTHTYINEHALTSYPPLGQGQGAHGQHARREQRQLLRDGGEGEREAREEGGLCVRVLKWWGDVGVSLLGCVLGFGVEMCMVYFIHPIDRHILHISIHNQPPTPHTTIHPQNQHRCIAPQHPHY